MHLGTKYSVLLAAWQHGEDRRRRALLIALESILQDYRTAVCPLRCTNAWYYCEWHRLLEAGMNISTGHVLWSGWREDPHVALATVGT